MNKFLRKTFFLLTILTISFYLFFIIVNGNNKSSIIGDIRIPWVVMREPRIFCFILTVEKNLEKKAKVIVDTWAKKCDNFKLISIIPKNFTNQMNSSGSHNDTNNGTQIYEMGNLLQPPGFVNDTYKKLTDKIYKTFKYAYEKYNDYDWYLKADDDTFIFVDNLRDFLADKNPKQPVTYGYDFKVLVEKGYHSGGGGYVLSREALHRLGSKLSENYTFCANTGTEDKDVAKCLRKLGVYPNKSLDDMGRERFHPLSMMAHYKGSYPKWLYSYSSNVVQSGLNCCSDLSTISFHYMSSKEILKLNDALETLQIEKKTKKISLKDILNKLYNLNL